MCMLKRTDIGSVTVLGHVMYILMYVTLQESTEIVICPFFNALAALTEYKGIAITFTGCSFNFVVRIHLDLKDIIF